MNSDDGVRQKTGSTHGMSDMEFRRIEHEEPYRDEYALASKWNAGHSDDDHTVWRGYKGGYYDIFWAAIRLAEREHPELIKSVVERNTRQKDTES